MLSVTDLDNLKRKYAPEPQIVLPPDDQAPPPDSYPASADGDPIFEPMNGAARTAPEPEIATLPPLTLDDWRQRDLPEPDFLMGHWLTTTTRMMLTAATGLGKTNFGLAVAQRASACVDFLHWRARRPCRVLYVDGEMSSRLLKARLLDEEKRTGTTPENFFALSHEDLKLRPLNTPDGQAWLMAFIKKVGGIDLVILDNIMCLTLGDQKDGEVWRNTLPLALALTKASIGQIWIHHTGHDESRAYGDSSRGWQMDTIAHLDRVERSDTDVSFTLSFSAKARERTPANRFDFQDVKIALVNDQWEHEVTEARRPDRISPRCQKALEALQNVLAGDQAKVLPGNRRAAHRDHWQAECTLLGLIDAEAKPHSARTLFATFRRELVAANRIACEGEMTWII
jgi:RecA-family ATPase